MPAGVGDIYAINWIGSIYSQRIMLTTTYVIHAINPDVEPSFVRSAALNEVSGGAGGDLIESDLLACMPPSYELARITCQPVFPIRLVYEDLVRNAAGTHNDDTEATNQAATITLQTEYAGRRYVATKHIGPIPQAATVQNNGEVAAAYKALLTTLGDSLTSLIVVPALGLTMWPVIWHRTHPPGHDDFTRIQEFFVGDEIRVMRRRTVRVGE